MHPTHPLWSAFVAFAEESGIGDVTDMHPDDWIDWWEMFLGGVEACLDFHEIHDHSDIRRANENWMVVRGEFGKHEEEE